jgi:hypothetical protein
MTTVVRQLTRQLQAITGKALDDSERDPGAIMRAIDELTAIRDRLNDPKERRLVQSYISRLRGPLPMHKRAS